MPPRRFRALSGSLFSMKCRMKRVMASPVMRNPSFVGGSSGNTDGLDEHLQRDWLDENLDVLEFEDLFHHRMVVAVAGEEADSSGVALAFEPPVCVDSVFPAVVKGHVEDHHDCV